MGSLNHFDETKFYKTTDPELAALLKPQTLIRWRCEGRGPRYVKLGGKVLYPGSALNEYIEARVVDPKPTAA